ncbi:hypothetical protein [Nocardia sp. NPDC005366]|uniref:hypothetical protein n=1 Tax=Nocardia sp. NPDC005366 TaxID=3156878 RepID=UPI0033AB347B
MTETIRHTDDIDEKADSAGSGPDTGDSPRPGAKTDAPAEPKRDIDAAAEATDTVKPTRKGLVRRSAVGRGKRPSASGVLAILATAAAVIVSVLWATDDSADELSALRGRMATDTAAQDAASNYAMNVSRVDFHNLDAWRQALRSNVSGQLEPKMNAAVDVVGPWLTEMEYTSTARLLAATVTERDGDRYVVQVFVDMNSKSKQSPNGVTATASYTVTMDRASNWTITDVGGVGGVGAGLPK